MKTFLFLLVFFFGGHVCMGQQQPKAVYDYDMAGNRIVRTILNLKSARSALPDQEREGKISNSLLACKVIAYPNPTLGEVILSISNGEEEAVSGICVYDANGKLLKKSEATGNVDVSIDLSSYPAGIYLIDFHQGESSSFYKIIKQ